MIAPTRDTVRDLNHLAQQSLFPHPDRETVPLADGLTGGVGDVIRTRRNNRHLTYSNTGWVKNGDTWTITATHTSNPENSGASGCSGGSVTARHQSNGLTVTLPAAYVREAVELGYATTIHGAQGTTVDTVHGLVTGRETRPDLYTLLTRGRHANHVYLALAGTSGDTHDLTRPAATRSPTAREVLSSIALRDGSAMSASTELDQAHSPALLHKTALARYEDALTVACQDVLGPDRVAAIEDTARTLIPGVEDQPAWPTLRSTLLRLAADNREPAATLRTALARGDERDFARLGDIAAILAWRVTRLADLETDLLPQRVAENSTWAAYLDRRSLLVESRFRRISTQTVTRSSPSQQPPLRDRRPSSPNAPR